MLLRPLPPRRHVASLYYVAMVAAMMVLPSCAWPQSAPPSARLDNSGTVGIVVRQLFSDSQPNHRGPLAVMHVFEGSPAAKAGIRCSDFIIAVNGVATPGRDINDIRSKELTGSVGSTVRLTLLRYDGSQSDITLSYAPYANPPSDPFAYSLPGDWTTDPRFFFPLPWASSLPYRGFEDIFFSPNFDETSSQEYHSFLFFWWLEGTPAIGADQLRSDMLIYFRGISARRGRDNGFTPDLSKVSASYAEDAPPLRTFGGAPAHAFSGTITIWDTHGKLITLNSEVVAAVCPGSNHTSFFFAQSLEPRGGEVWKELDAGRDSFRCAR
jgi:hypothetical protein